MIMAGAQKRINDKIYLVGEYIQFPKIMDEGASSQAVLLQVVSFTQTGIGATVAASFNFFSSVFLMIKFSLLFFFAKFAKHN